MANNRSVTRLWLVIFLALISLAAGPRLRAAVPGASYGEPRTHVVTGGESLWALAEEYARGEDPRRYIHRIQQLNRLSTVQLFPGQTLILPSDP